MSSTNPTLATLTAAELAEPVDPRGLWVLARIRVVITGSNGATLFSGETRKLKRAMP